MSHKERSELRKSESKGMGPGTRSGVRAGNRPGERRSSGTKPSGTNVSRGGGSAAITRSGSRSQSKAKSKRGG